MYFFCKFLQHTDKFFPILLQFSNLYKTQKEDEDSGDDSDEESEDDEETAKKKPDMDFIQLKHDGCINRIRVSTQSHCLSEQVGKCKYSSVFN